jgi:membrane associated rhomboid family serine protease
VPYFRRPTVALSLIAVNILVHLVTQSLQLLEGAPLQRLFGESSGPGALPAYVDALALTPEKVAREGGWRHIQFLTANFLHTDWIHLLFNLWYFYLFSVNLEDRWGGLRFGVLMAAGMTISQFAVFMLTPGLGADRAPHAGFSGVVYATLAAYLVCLPRSKVNVVLIYSVSFWLIFLFVGGAVTVLMYLLVGPLAQLAWLAFFVLAFIYLEPGHISFGIPAFIFLGHRVIFDVMTVERQMGSSVSVWSHAGGFVAGLAVALVFNGLRGLRETFEQADDHPPLTQRERERQRALSLAEAAGRDEGAARELLGRLVFLGNAGAAARLYTDTVMFRHPRLCLDLPAMVTLVRMLEAQGHAQAALNACVRAIAQHGNETGIEQIYLHAARLCAGIQGRGAEGLQYIDAFLSLAVLNRDKYEAKKLREALAEQARQEGLATIPADQAEGTKRAPVTPAAQPAADDDPWAARKLALRGAGEVSPRRRMGQLETDGDAAAPTPPTLEGWKPLPFRTPAEPGAAEDDANHASEPPPMLPVASRASVLEVPRRAQASPPATTSQEIRTAAPLPREPLDPSRPNRAETPGKDDLFAPPSISLTKAADARLHHVSREPVASGSARGLCLVLLRDAEPGNDQSFDDRLAALASRTGIAARRVAGHPLAIVRALPVSCAGDLADAAAGLAISHVLADGDHPALTMEPLEAISMTLDEHGVTFRTARESIRRAFSEWAVVHFSGMRLSPSSKGARMVIEAVAHTDARRVQVWSRTVMAARCSIMGMVPSPENMLTDMARALAQRVDPAALTPVTADAVRDGGAIAEFVSFEDYEDYVLYHILLRTGRPPQ